MLKTISEKATAVFIAFLVVLTPAALSQIKVACIGNSITAGGYPKLLGENLGTDWEVKNFGVSGATLLKNGDLPYYKQKKWEEVKSFAPDVAIIKLGTNDSKPQNWKYSGEYVPDYNWMISELKALPSKPYIILCYPVPAYSHGWDIRDSVIKYEAIPMIKKLAQDNGLKVIDLYEALSGHKEWFPDGIHPNEEGSREIASVIGKSLLKFKKSILKGRHVEFGMASTFSQNPIIKHIYTADPAARVFKDTLFVYTSHDEDTATWFYMKDWHVFSTTDMKKWTDHGPVLSLSDLSWAKRAAWAPDCAYANGQYYFYFPVETNSIGVAVSSNPQGKFKDALNKPLITRQTPGVVCSGYLIDPTVFIDDDGSAYLLLGMNNLNIVKLNKDMISISDTVRQVKGADNFFEAVWMHKYKGKYYLSYSGQFDSTGAGKLLYSIADNPYGPYEYKGVLLDERNSGTNHHSIVQYKGDWYLFYHNSDLYYSQHPEEKPVVNWGGKSPFRRSICVDRLYYNEDGTIKKVIPTNAGVSAGRN